MSVCGTEPTSRVVTGYFAAGFMGEVSGDGTAQTGERGRRPDRADVCADDRAPLCRAPRHANSWKALSQCRYFLHQRTNLRKMPDGLDAAEAATFRVPSFSPGAGDLGSSIRPIGVASPRPQENSCLTTICCSNALAAGGGQLADTTPKSNSLSRTSTPPCSTSGVPARTAVGRQGSPAATATRNPRTTYPKAPAQVSSPRLDLKVARPEN